MFKDRLREARKNANLSQEALGKLVGVSKQTISDYERGYSEPDMNCITELMHHLRIDANYLWQDEMDDVKRMNVLDPKSIAVAYAYDKMTPYGRSIIDLVIENESKYGRAIRIISNPEEEAARTLQIYKDSLEELE